MRTRWFLCTLCLAAMTGAAVAQTDADAFAPAGIGRASAYQGRGQEQTERFSRRIRLGRDGRVSISNIAGDITVTGGSSDEVSIEAIKRTRGDRRELANVDINVEERAGRVDVRVEPMGRHDRVSVDFTVTIPQSAALDVHSVSGSLKVTGIRGPVRAESVSGNVTTGGTPRIEAVKSVSGNIDLSDVSSDGDLTAGSVSGNVRARGLKSRGLDLNSVSGDVVLTDVACERLDVKSVSGSVEYSGSLARRGRYDVNSHSGTVRFALSGDIGFELDATSFSGSVRSDFPVTLTSSRNADRRDRDRRGDRGFPGMNRSMHATFGDGSATLNLRTFSGDVIVSKR